MILLVDIGNTRIKWMLWDQGEVTERGSLIYQGIDRPSLAERLWGTLARPSQVVIANVAGAEMAAALSAWIARSWSLQAQFAYSETAAFGIKNAYAVPHRLGVDRWVAMMGARTLTTQACCVVDCGTAITIDGLSASGIHLGGVIFPGVRLMRKALYRDTRQIPIETGQAMLFGKDTQDGVWGGTIHAVAAGIDRVSGRMEAVMEGEVRRLLTGGDADDILPFLEGEYQLEPDLIFYGLQVIAGQQ
jgi:type III pantothenate kinase